MFYLFAQQNKVKQRTPRKKENVRTHKICIYENQHIRFSYYRKMEQRGKLNTCNIPTGLPKSASQHEIEEKERPEKETK